MSQVTGFDYSETQHALQKVSGMDVCDLVAHGMSRYTFKNRSSVEVRVSEGHVLCRLGGKETYELPLSHATSLNWIVHMAVHGGENGSGFDSYVRVLVLDYLRGGIERLGIHPGWMRRPSSSPLDYRQARPERDDEPDQAGRQAEIRARQEAIDRRNAEIFAQIPHG